MKIKRMGITEILRRIWLFSATKIKGSESFSKQPTQLIIVAHIVTFLCCTGRRFRKLLPWRKTKKNNEKKFVNS